MTGRIIVMIAKVVKSVLLHIQTDQNDRKKAISKFKKIGGKNLSRGGQGRLGYQKRRYFSFWPNGIQIVACHMNKTVTFLDPVCVNASTKLVGANCK